CVGGRAAGAAGAAASTGRSAEAAAGARASGAAAGVAAGGAAARRADSIAVFGGERDDAPDALPESADGRAPRSPRREPAGAAAVGLVGL
ncbi:hypothetical protein, partial [Burkholderia pseudomallei]|uniref:hypothetical protein n=1 Tax=Burkholderia pseudomallei TaxID=28450 RepID=UPI001C4BB944